MIPANESSVAYNDYPGGDDGAAVLHVQVVLVVVVHDVKVGLGEAGVAGAGPHHVVTDADIVGGAEAPRGIAGLTINCNGFLFFREVN